MSLQNLSADATRAPNCRCADGSGLHEATVLSYSQGGKTRFVMLPADQVAAVRAATVRYQAAMARLEAAAAKPR